MAQNRFFETACHVAVSNNFDTCGTITRASVGYLTPQQLEDLFKPGGKFTDIDAMLRTQVEMQACGIRRHPLADWLASSTKQIPSILQNKITVDRGPSLLQPFILGRQDSVINADFWAITSGQANSAYTALVTGPLTAADLALGVAADRVIRVVSRYGIDMDAMWFPDRERIQIFGRSGGHMTQGQWKVLAAEQAADRSYVDVLITSQNTGNVAPYDTAPTSGVVVSTGPYVNDYESWCHNRPTLDPRKRVPFWVETRRRSRCVDSEYMKVFERLMNSGTNEYFVQFGDLPLAERNRQDEELFMKQYVNKFFWGKPVSSNQTLTLWQNLRQIKTVTGTNIDPGTGGKLMAYEAYSVGVLEQLRACDRVRDLGNNNLNLYEFWDELYNIMRSRESSGKVSDSIDMFTDSVSAANFETGYVNYAKNEWGDIIRVEITASTSDLGFKYKSYNPKFPQGVTLNVLTDRYFDDWVNAFDTESIDSSGRMMLILDIGKPGPKGGTIYPGVIASNSKKRTLGEIELLGKLDPQWACTMENPTEDIMSYSQTDTVIVECPSHSLAILGIANGVPVTTGKTTPYGNLY